MEYIVLIAGVRISAFLLSKQLPHTHTKQPPQPGKSNYCLVQEIVSVVIFFSVVYLVGVIYLSLNPGSLGTSGKQWVLFKITMLLVYSGRCEHSYTDIRNNVCIRARYGPVQNAPAFSTPPENNV